MRAVHVLATDAAAFYGLGWATAAVLRLENEQRKARAEAEQLGQLRLALWQLDSFILPDLSREDARPYYHYASRRPGLGWRDYPGLLSSAALKKQRVWMRS